MDLYEILGVKKDVSTEEITKRYKTLAKKMHPDKLTNPTKEEIEKFQEITNAYNVLSDEKKRQEYDSEKRGGQFINLNDFLKSFHMSFSNHGEDMNDVINVNVSLTLEEMYNGCSKEIKYNRKLFCKTCNGDGGHDKKHCVKCHGNGYFMRFLTPDICLSCDGKGFQISKKCGTCKGKKNYIEYVEKKLKFNHGVGVNNNIFVLKNVGNQMNGGLGHVRLIINQIPQKSYERRGDILIKTLEISFIESFTRKEYTFKHINNDIVKFTTDEVIDPTKTYTIPKLSFNNNDLHIRFKINYPKQSEIPPINI